MFKPVKYSKQGYKRTSPDRNNPVNVIGSGRITMKDVPHPVYGMDNLGNSILMHPNGEYQFPGNVVKEIPIRKAGGFVPLRKAQQGMFTPDNAFEPKNNYISTLDYGFTNDTTKPPPTAINPSFPQRRQKDDLSFLPLFANSIFTAISARVDDNRKRQYEQANLANPLNYLPSLGNNGGNNYTTQGEEHFQDGGETDDFDDMDDGFLFDENPTPQAAPQAEEQTEETPQTEEDPDIPIDNSIWDNTDAMTTSPANTPIQDSIPDSTINYPAHLQGTSAAVRNNNPGNIKYSPFSASLGAIRGDLAADGDGTYHARFPDVETGIRAMEALISSKGYRDLPVHNALNRWITGSQNKEGAYAKRAADLVDNKKIKDLSPTELRQVVHQMIKGEDGNMAKQLGI